MAHLYHVLNVNSSRERLYRAFSDFEEVKKWWTTDAECLSREPLIYFFRFPSGAQNKMQVLEEDAGHKVTWKCIDGHQEWVGTEIEFRIVGEEPSLQLHFRHSRWTEETSFLGTCNHFWGLYLGRLKENCET